MCTRRHWFDWSVMLVMTAALFASLPPDRIFSSAGGGPTRLSKSNPKASLVIPKDDVDAGKISYLAIVPPIFGCDKGKKITLIGGIGGCRMNNMWTLTDDNEKRFLLETGNKPGGANEDGSSSVSVDVFDDGVVALNHLNHSMDCKVITQPNNNTVQGGKVVDFAVENTETCPNMEIKFDNRYKLYEPPGSPISEESDKRDDNTVLMVCLSVAGALLLLAAIGFGLWCLWKHRKKNPMPVAPTDVKVVLAEGTKPKVVNNSPDLPKMTAISNTYVKTTQPNHTPEVKPSKAIQKQLPKLEPCPTEETETPLPRVIVSSKKKKEAQPKVVISSSKKKDKPSKKKAVNKINPGNQVIQPYPPVNIKYKKGKSAVFADLSEIQDYKTPASTCKTKEPNTMERSAQRNKCVEETSIEEQKPVPPSTKRVPRLQRITTTTSAVWKQTSPWRSSGRLLQPSVSLDCGRAWIHTSAAWRINEAVQKILIVQVSSIIFL